MSARGTAALLAAAAAGVALALLRTGPLAVAARECARPPAPDPRAQAAGMVALPGGTFTMGSERFHPEEAPRRQVRVDAFMIDRHEVTNAQFAAFVAATGYVTDAERGLSAASRPDLPPALRVPGASVFHLPAAVGDLADPSQWWRYVPGANWRHPEGPGSDLRGRAQHPVVNVTRADARAYAHWLGRELPTEAQWEYAARGGLDGEDYTWGAQAVPGGRWQANAWQGLFPLVNTVADGHAGTAPVGCYPANGYGLHDMAGNVWELTADDWPGAPGQPVARGGSFLCGDNYCLRYRPAARVPVEPDLGLSHTGFRTVRGPAP